MKSRTFKIILALLILVCVFPIYKGLSATMQARHASSPGTTLDDGLVGHWTFDGADMTSGTALDKSGSNNTGTLTNIGMSSRVAGVMGQGLQFDGVDDFVIVGWIGFSGSMSLSAWVYIDEYPGAPYYDGRIISRSNTNGRGYILGVGSDGSLYMQTSQDCSNVVQVTSSSTLPTKSWILVTGIYIPGQSMSLYANGVKVGERLSSIPSSQCYSSNAANIGASTTDYPTPFKGTLDDVRMYNRALSVDEIHQLYKMGEGTTMGVDPTSDPLAEGLAGYWKFDEASGTTSIDSSVNGNTGTLTNGPTRTSGKVGGALMFDGTDDYITVPDSNSLDMTTNWTVSAWVNFTAFYTGECLGNMLVSKYADNQVGFYALSVGDTGGCGAATGIKHATFQVRFSDNTSSYVIGAANLTTGIWYHLLGSYDGSNLRVYVNGVLDGTTAVTKTAGNNGGALHIGRMDYANFNYNVNGKIDEVRVYHRALSQDEVATLYRTTKPTEVDTSLVGHWTFDGPTISGTTVRDLSGAGNNGTLTNGPTKTVGVLGQGLQFDGSDDVVISNSNSSAIANLTQTTVSFWINPSTFSGVSGIFGTLTYDGGGNGPFVNGFGISRDSTSGNQTIRFVVDSSSGQMVVRSGTVLPLNTWTHVVVVWDGSLNGANTKFYYNGNLTSSEVYENGSGSYTPSDGRFKIGRMSHESGFFNGALDDVRVYNRVLTADEIYKMYKVGVGSTMNIDTITTTTTITPHLESGLAGYWPLDNGSGVTASDLSVNGNNGTLTGGPTWGTGKVGGAVTFDGTDDYIVKVSPTGLPTGSEARTFSTWFKSNVLPSSGSGQEIFGLGGNSGDGDRAGLWIENNLSCAGQYALGVEIINAGLLYPWIPDSQWHHLVFAYSGGNINTATIYLDGVLLRNSCVASAVAPNTTNTQLSIGKVPEANIYFSGNIDEVRIYNRALSADEVAILYRTTIGTKASEGLVGYWPFNGPDVTDKIYDRSGAGNNGYFVGGATTSAKTIGQVGQGLQFDGVDDYVSVGNYSGDVGSISAWFKPEFFLDPSNMYSIYGGVVGGNNFSLGVNTFGDTNGIDFSIRGSFGATLTAKGTNHGSDNVWLQQWHHVVATWDVSSGLQLFVDGVLDGTVSGSTGSLATMDFTVGYTPFQGTIDEVRRYNRVLSAQEVKQLYNSGR